jgi:hypothetical protein
VTRRVPRCRHQGGNGATRASLLLEPRSAGDFSPNHHHLHQPMNGIEAQLPDPARWEPMECGGGGSLQIWRRRPPKQPRAMTAAHWHNAAHAARVLDRIRVHRSPPELVAPHHPRPPPWHPWSSHGAPACPTWEGLHRVEERSPPLALPELCPAVPADGDGRGGRGGGGLGELGFFYCPCIARGGTTRGTRGLSSFITWVQLKHAYHLLVRRMRCSFFLQIT